MTLKTSSDYISEIADRVNIVDGKPTWEHAENKQNDLAFMLRCCDAEMHAMQKADLVAAPFYFERVAILLRKSGEYQQEIDFCKNYIAMVDLFYQTKDINKFADIRKVPRFQAI